MTKVLTTCVRHMLHDRVGVMSESGRWQSQGRVRPIVCSSTGNKEDYRHAMLLTTNNGNYRINKHFSRFECKIYLSAI